NDDPGDEAAAVHPPAQRAASEVEPEPGAAHSHLKQTRARSADLREGKRMRDKGPIGHLLMSVDALKEPAEPALDLYFKQCSIMVSAIDLAFIGATIANLGIHPISGEQVFDIEAVRDVQSV